jgi:hypothetical protein
MILAALIGALDKRYGVVMESIVFIILGKVQGKPQKNT